MKIIYGNDSVGIFDQYNSKLSNNFIYVSRQLQQIQHFMNKKYHNSFGPSYIGNADRNYELDGRVILNCRNDIKYFNEYLEKLK